MGLFSKINEKAGLIGAIIAIAILLLILGDIVSKQTKLFSGTNNVGKIAGHEVTPDEYSKLVDQVKQNMGGANMGDYQELQARNQAWSYLILKYAYPEQYKKVGVEVTDKELEGLVSGPELWEGFSTIPNFQDPNTHQFDRKLYDQWKAGMLKQEKGEEFLDNLKQEQILPDRLRNKYLSLFNNTVYYTKEEAIREYQSQNSKAEVKYLYIPYYSIPDSVIKVSDSDLADYVKKHDKEYEKELRASVEYVVFTTKASAIDSSEVMTQLADLKKEFETTTDDSTFAASNSDNPASTSIVRLGELPDSLKLVAESLEKGKVYGPVSDMGKVKLYKVLDVIQDPKDSMYYASTKHILFMTRGKSDQEKDSIRKKATDVLNQLKNGADFNAMVQQYTEDPGSKAKNGEYKWFPKGQMVKPFENAVMNAKSLGLVPTLVETEYGLHILKVTDLKSNKKFKIASIEKEILPTEGKDKAYQSAINFSRDLEDSLDFHAAVKRDSLQLQKFDNITTETPYVNSLANPRELIRWALVNGEVNDVSPVFSVGDNFVVATLIRQREKGTAEADEVKDEVKQKVLAEKKAEMIIEKLKKQEGGNLEKKAQAYGTSATVGTAMDVTMASGSMQGIGQEPAIVGKVFGLAPGRITNPLKGDYGVVILQLVKITDAPPVADYSTYKTTLVNNRKQNIMMDIDNAIKEDADIIDNRIKFY